MSIACALAELGLNEREVVHNVITALTSNTMIAPSFWMDPKTGYDYMLTVQYPESAGQESSVTCVRFRCAPRGSRIRHGWML